MKTISEIPAIEPRRPLDDDAPDGYLESDKDFVENNFDVCVWFLEHAQTIKSILDRHLNP